MTNKMRFLIILLFSLTIIACTHTVYGVSPQRWKEMSETQRQHIREEFLQREELLEKTRIRAEESRIRAESIKKEAEEHERLCREEPKKCEKTQRQRLGF
jgi:TRAP-type C4-dicarboxylate transport system substrate-binding protein